MKKYFLKLALSNIGFWESNEHNLIVTNHNLVLEKTSGLNFNNRITRYNYSDIKQVIVNNKEINEMILEVYIEDKKETFSVTFGDELTFKVLALAINDQLGECSIVYDYDYYQSILEQTKIEHKNIEQEIKNRKKDNRGNSDSAKKGIEFVGEVAKNVAKSGDYSIKGITKGITKTTKKNARKSIFGGFVDELLDDMGIYDIQDEFTEIGNDFREMVGLKPKKTHEEEREEREEIERKQKNEYYAQKKELEMLKNKAFENVVNIKREEYQNKNNPKTESAKAKLTVIEQIDALKKLDELLKNGAITQEEFDKKKKEVLDL